MLVPDGAEPGVITGILFINDQKSLSSVLRNGAGLMSGHIETDGDLFSPESEYLFYTVNICI